jgi:hypothetical protein
MAHASRQEGARCSRVGGRAMLGHAWTYALRSGGMGGGGRSAVVGRSTLGRVGAKRRSPGHGVTRGRLRRLSRHRSWGRVGLA